MNLDLGGPGAGCSSSRVRRLLAGELLDAEAQRTSAHLAGCARCAAVQREVEEERVDLQRLAPFDQLAAGVAEKLARQQASPARPGRARTGFAGLGAHLQSRLIPLAAAAGLLLVSGVALQQRQAEPEAGAAEQRGVRSKGAGSATIFVQDPRARSGIAGVKPAPPLVRELARGEKVPRGAALRVVLHEFGFRQAAVVLVEPHERTVLFSGSTAGEPEAFEWTGDGPAVLLIVFSDAALDPARLRAARDLPPEAQTLEIPLSR